MARIDSLANFLEDVATKIRSKTGSQSTITPANYDTEIEKIVFKPNTGIVFNPKGSFSSISKDTTTTSIDLSNLDTSNMTTMQNMFGYLTKLTSINLSNFNPSNVTRMDKMFFTCSSLETITFGNNFNTSSLLNMQSMFGLCIALTSIDVSSFDTSNVQVFSSTFNACDNLETITFGNNWSFASATTLSNMFGSSYKLDNNTLNAILHLCTTVGNNYTANKTLSVLGINDAFDNFANIPNLSNYQAFLDAGWTIS